MRAWDAFTGLDSMVKNMMTSLRAVGELQNTAIRDRHWQQLMEATQVSELGHLVGIMLMVIIHSGTLESSFGVLSLQQNHTDDVTVCNHIVIPNCRCLYWLGLIEAYMCTI